MRGWVLSWLQKMVYFGFQLNGRLNGTLIPPCGNVEKTILLTHTIGNFYYKTNTIAQTLADVKDM